MSAEALFEAQDKAQFLKNQAFNLALYLRINERYLMDGDDLDAARAYTKEALEIMERIK